MFLHFEEIDSAEVCSPFVMRRSAWVTGRVSLSRSPRFVNYVRSLDGERRQSAQGLHRGGGGVAVAAAVLGMRIF